MTNAIKKDFSPPPLIRANFLSPHTKTKFIDYLLSLIPLWEMRYSEHHPPPPGDTQRRLKRPVFWLGNWQFACLGYYHPPEGLINRSLHSLPYPQFMQNEVFRIEKLIRQAYPKEFIPLDWKLNTCLINYYGETLGENNEWVDTARVGEHKDFEPGPVASLSFGERALFQFVTGKAQSKALWEYWLSDNSLQVFAGKKWKDQLFHRVQRVEKKQKILFPIQVEGFRTRRINLTFRFVPPEHICWANQIPPGSYEDILPYLQTLSEHYQFFKAHLA